MVYDWAFLAFEMCCRHLAYGEKKKFIDFYIFVCCSILELVDILVKSIPYGLCSDVRSLILFVN